jgi:hypothetical protein
MAALAEGKSALARQPGDPLCGLVAVALTADRKPGDSAVT